MPSVLSVSISRVSGFLPYDTILFSDWANSLTVGLLPAASLSVLTVFLILALADDSEVEELCEDIKNLGATKL